MSTMSVVRRIPLIISTIFKHFIYGPPQPSWNLKLHLASKIIQSFFMSSDYEPPYTIEQIQGFVPIFLNSKIPPFIKIDKIIIPHGYRINAEAYIEKLVKPYSIALDQVWKSPRINYINGELIMNKDWDKENDWEKEKIIIYFHGGAYFAGRVDIARDALCELSKESGARVLAINYRSAPQQPFPAALCDALATYLYLISPNNSGFKPYKPEQIILCGDSSGGGLSISLGLVLRDLGLPLPAGIVGWSPWIDLTHSLPSFLEPIMDKADALPPKPGYLPPINPNSIAYSEFRSRTITISRNIQQHPEIKLIGDDSLKRIGDSVNFYIVNEGLGIPYVSPMLAESLGGLPPMLINVGNVERLRDEAIYFSYRAANPEKYRLPVYEVDFDNSRFKSPSKITLEVYDEMFHGFHFLEFCKQSKISIKRTADFINNVTQEDASTNPSFEALKINYHGEVQNLDESSINVLKWDKAGVFPGV